MPVEQIPESESDSQAIEPRAVRDEPLLKGQRVAFTGVLASMTHREAFRLVEQHGGEPVPHVSRSVTMLVVGEEGWPLDEGRTAVKFRDACRLIAEGAPIRILNEPQWLQILGMTERRPDRAELYTPAMLSQLLGIPPHLVRRWTRLGLLQPVKRVFRLPYFDLSHVNRLQRLCELLESGLTPAQVESALRRLADVLGPPDRVLAELDLLRHGSRVLLRDAYSLIDPRSGQRLFDFEASPPEARPAMPSGAEANAASRTTRPGQRSLGASGGGIAAVSASTGDAWQQVTEYSFEDWFELGCELLESSAPDAVRQAAECFRMCLMDRPFDAETHFLLAEALYRTDNPLGAIERYHCAIECDHEYLEAWIQLGCVYAALDRHEEALAAFDTALELHPESPEAALQKGLLLCELKRHDEAAPLLQSYLDAVPHGPWADHARDLLDTAADARSAHAAKTGEAS